MKPQFSPAASTPSGERALLAIIQAIESSDELDARRLDRIVRQFPKPGGGAFSKSDIIRAYRTLADQHQFQDERAFRAKVRMKPIRTASGVSPVTVLTKPFPCPGRCVFCPSDVRMPKSYLSREPGAQRAAQHRFDPYYQTLSRLYAFHNTGHDVDKVELIVLGGTWSFYPEPYQVWFVKRCFDAMNDFSERRATAEGHVQGPPPPVDFADLQEEVDGRTRERSYNQIVSGFLGEQLEGRLIDNSEEATWQDLQEAQKVNERAVARCVGLVLETRPDHLDDDEVVRLRRLGATKVQIGIQSLSDEILEANKRGHDVAATRRAIRRLRAAGFKLHVHWMPNLVGATPAGDIEDFKRLFDDPAIRPDELKVYPCSLIETAELMQFYENGSWQPYSGEELLEILTASLLEVPPYCRVTRVIRDIPGDDIVTGNKTTNFREVAERELAQRGQRSRDIRAREIRNHPVDPERLQLDRVEYETSTGKEFFLQWIQPPTDPSDHERLVAFLRLALPREPVSIPEIADAAMIREVHVYGVVVSIGGGASDGRSQHLGLGRRLIDEAAEIARQHGFQNLAVISSVGTRDYYRRQGFVDQELYQHRSLVSSNDFSGDPVAIT